jgi:hypothetical protein
MRAWATISLTASPEMKLGIPLQTEAKAAVYGVATQGLANKEEIQGSSIP